MRNNDKKKWYHVGASLLLFLVTFQTQAGIGSEVVSEAADLGVTLRDAHGARTGSCYKTHARGVVTCILTLQLYGSSNFVTISNIGNSTLLGLTYTPPGDPSVAQEATSVVPCLQHQSLAAGAFCTLGYIASGHTAPATTSVTVNTANAGSLTVQIDVTTLI